MSQSPGPPDERSSPQPQSTVARLEEASYQNGIEERQRALEQQVAEGSKGEIIWATENEEMLSDIKEGTEEIDLSHSRIRTLRGFEKHLPRLAPHLKRVNLRQNLISALRLKTMAGDTLGGTRQAAEGSTETANESLISPFEFLTELEELDLYDNQIEKIQGLGTLKALKSLDLSFNLLRRIENLEDLRSLRTLYLIQNKISQIEGLESLADSLTSLELGSNRIRHITNLAPLTNLTELWLGRNKISKLEGLDTLINLKSLSIQSNRIVKLEGLDKLTALEELYISHNGLTKVGDGLSANKKLRTLDIAANQIDDLAGIEGLSNLEEFWANDNKLSVASFNSIAPALSETWMPKLQTIYLERNPLQNDMGANYRRKLILACPQVIQIDATFVKGA